MAPSGYKPSQQQTVVAATKKFTPVQVQGATNSQATYQQQMMSQSAYAAAAAAAKIQQQQALIQKMRQSSERQ